MSEKKFNYVYLTINLINGKQYIGDHSTDILEDGYLGGGEYLKKAFRKYGRKKFQKKILKFFPSKEEAFNAQEKYIIEYKTLVPFGYNISPKGGHNVQGGLAEETKNKIRKTLKESPPFTEERKNNISKGLIGKTAWNKDKRGIYKTSEKTKEKQRKALEGKSRPILVKQNISKSLIGRHLSQEHRDNISSYQKTIEKKTICPFCHKEINARQFRRSHRRKCKINTLKNVK